MSFRTNPEAKTTGRSNVSFSLFVLFVVAWSVIVKPSSCHAFHPTRTTTITTRPSSASTTTTTTTTATSSTPYAFAPTTVTTGSTVIDAPTKEDIGRQTRRRTGGGNDENDTLGDQGENFDDAVRKQGPLEWLEDMEEPRDMEDPFHILLLGLTFEKPKITIAYVASSLEYVLGMPVDEALELSQFSHDHGMSCLGVWPREECLKLGRQLQVRDIVCRVVPYVEGGQRAWQAKDASASSSSSSGAAGAE